LLLFSIEQSKRLKGAPITANAVHPGIVRTRMMATAQGFFTIIAYFAFPFAISPQKGAATSVYLASSRQGAIASGLYFTNCRPVALRSKFNTDEARTRLWH
jgi:retinol dehydrogenase 12